MTWNNDDPKSSGEYLVIGHGGTRFICYWDGKEWYRQSRSKKQYGITAWRVLP